MLFPVHLAFAMCSYNEACFLSGSWVSTTFTECTAKTFPAWPASFIVSPINSAHLCVTAYSLQQQAE